ncbi:uncharacterized protein KIAA0513 [Ischnura elegans]|uniref:uncharacterized protein KIAA0513 n=1 Tax=Ischnura elegans TaxID=197161 RepID=UPI001ED8A385|nr:uncharacterized protein KIAA0513 [Ischnura elegans]XP_046385869.1 uncharacterized protein KIAA0513 [Ischnura elegans]XP_046385870.1 uncharacterized protein KIAA0513 [Ischnura elegans]
MVDVKGAIDEGGRSTQPLGGLVGRTRGALRLGLRSVLEGSNGLLSGLSSRLGSALSLVTDEDEAESHSKLSGYGYDNEENGIEKEENVGGQSCSTISDKCNPEIRATGPDPFDKLKVITDVPPASSASGSEGEGYGPSTSLDTSDHDCRKPWGGIHSGSEGSVQSWASSLSLDTQSEEGAGTMEAAEFMRLFVKDLFDNPGSIQSDRKARFGQLAQHEAGRLWFARFVNARRVQGKRVSEATFYGLVQHFAVALFECAEADDFSPAKSLMNMCFTFYHQVEKAGCEPYREYPAAYLREQPIWRSLRFWNAAFFDALQGERSRRVLPIQSWEPPDPSSPLLTEERSYLENAAFGQLGTFTCNMHAFGLSKEMVLEFLRKQCFIASLRPEQEKMLRENIDRMYSETDPC